MYRTKLEKLQPATIKSLQNDLITSGKSFSELADRYGMFPNDVQKIASEMGMSGFDTPTHSKIIEAPAIKKERVPHKVKRKTPVKVTPTIEAQIIEELKKWQEKGWKNFTKKKLLVKFNITNSGIITRIAEKAGIVIGAPVTTTVSEKVEDTITSSVVIGPINETEITEFPEEEIGLKISVKLDNSFAIQGITSFIFDKLSETEDYDSAVKKYFDHNIKGKKVEYIKLYSRAGRYDKVYMLAMSKIIKACCENHCNLSLVDGTTSTEIVSGYSSLTPDIQAIFDKCPNDAKFIYKANYENIKGAKVLFFASAKFSNSKNNQCIVTDTLDKILIYLAKYEKATSGVSFSHSIFISSVSEGKITHILKVIKGDI